MVKNRRKVAAAVTLIEAMVSMVVLAVAVLGASGYRYYAALDSHKAGMHRTGSAIALLLCENWRGRGYAHTIPPTAFDPVGHLKPPLDISVSGVGPDVPAGFTELGRYKIVVEGVCYWVTLSYQDISTPEGLRALNVIVGWKQAGSKIIFDQTVKLFRLTTYVSN